MEAVGSARWLEHRKWGVVEMRLEVEMGVMQEMRFQLREEELTEKASMEIKMGKGIITLRSSCRNQEPNSDCC